MGYDNQIDCPIAGVIIFTNPNNGTFAREIPKISPYICCLFDVPFNDLSTNWHFWR